MENIIPSAEVRNNYKEISKHCRETREPIFITLNGHGDTVILNITLYRQMTAELELLRAISAGESDIEQGRTKPADKVFDGIRKRCGL